MAENQDPVEAQALPNAFEIKEGQQPPKYLVRSLFASIPAEDPFGDHLSVVQELPEHNPASKQDANRQPEPPAPAPDPQALNDE